MQSRLIVENFGPIEAVDLQLKNVNVFIGPQASGKSALAKIYTICKSPMAFIKYETTDTEKVDITLSFQNFKQVLQDYNVLSFWSEKSKVIFTSELHDIEIDSLQIIYTRKIFEKIREIRKIGFNTTNKESLYTRLVEFDDIFFSFYYNIRMLLDFTTTDAHPSTEQIKELLLKKDISLKDYESTIDLIIKTEESLSENPALYIPAERNFIPIISGSVLSLLKNEVPIPKHIINFGAEFEKARSILQELDLSFIDLKLKYSYEGGKDIIYYSEENKINLIEAASGIQSAVPLLLPIILKNNNALTINNSFVIEEPELNLFPKTQYSLIKQIEKNRIRPLKHISDIGTIHTYTTHSPYILSSFNNFLFFGKVYSSIRAENFDATNSMKEAIGNAEKVTEQYDMPIIARSEFAAYQVCNGKAASIVDETTGLIKENFIDEASDEMQDDFDSLMELMKEYDSAD